VSSSSSSSTEFFFSLLFLGQGMVVKPKKMRERFWSFPIRDNTKKEGERKRERTVDGGGAKKKKENVRASFWHLDFFLHLFFSDPKLLIFKFFVRFIQHFINPTK